MYKMGNQNLVQLCSEGQSSSLQGNTMAFTGILKSYVRTCDSGQPPGLLLKYPRVCKSFQGSVDHFVRNPSLEFRVKLTTASTHE